MYTWMHAHTPQQIEFYIKRSEQREKILNIGRDPELNNKGIVIMQELHSFRKQKAPI